MWMLDFVVGLDMIIELFCCRSVFEYSGELWVVDIGYYLGGVYGVGVDIDFDDVCFGF